ncbi:long-chain fatty acid--CoA ligase [soil metagenome]
MKGLMQDRPLTLTHIFSRAEQMFGDARVITAGDEADKVTSVRDWSVRVRRLAAAFDALGASDDARIGTLAMNSQAHLEAYYAAPITGRILHTINMRLTADHLAFVINHAEDEIVIVDRGLAHLLEDVLHRVPTVAHWIVVDDGSGAPLPPGAVFLDYEELLAATPPHEGRFEVRDENRASGLCYTSGTTGDPKGVLYSHRSTVLHSLGQLGVDSLGIREADIVMPIVPMFHVNAWGLPYAAMLAGADLVLPARSTQPAQLLSLMERHGVTMAAAATTVWNFAAPYLGDFDLSSLRMVMSGGSATPSALSEAWRERAGIPITHSWGMTEISPVAVIGGVRAADGDASEERKAELRALQGRPVPMVELRLVDDDGDELPWDGEAVGEVQVAGPWVASGYYRRESEGMTDDGWLRSGDLGAIDPLGYLRIVDRVKDIIKSGGEWISSVDLENAIMSHPDIMEAAVVGRPDEKWAERPVAYVVGRDGALLTAELVREHLRPLVARWWLPEDIVFLAELPKTGSGKFSKTELRRLWQVTVEGAEPEGPRL